MEDFINDATFRAGEKGGLHIPHVISTDACTLKNKDAYGFEDENIVQNALESLRIELREICEFLSDEENLALMNTNVRYYNNDTRVINATTTTSVPSLWSDDQIRAFELASQFMIENEEYDLNVTNDGELSASLFPPGGDYYYGTSSSTLPTAKDEENVKHLALACSKLSEGNTCKRGIIISASINVSSTASARYSKRERRLGTVVPTGAFYRARYRPRFRFPNFVRVVLRRYRRGARERRKNCARCFLLLRVHRRLLRQPLVCHRFRHVLLGRVRLRGESWIERHLPRLEVWGHRKRVRHVVSWFIRRLPVARGQRVRRSILELKKRQRRRQRCWRKRKNRTRTRH